VLSLPHALRILLANDPDAPRLVLGVVDGAISRSLIDQTACVGRVPAGALCL
jgi:hypothetical protein